MDIKDLLSALHKSIKHGWYSLIPEPYDECVFFHETEGYSETETYSLYNFIYEQFGLIDETVSIIYDYPNGVLFISFQHGLDLEKIPEIDLESYIHPTSKFSKDLNIQIHFDSDCEKFINGYLDLDENKPSPFTLAPAFMYRKLFLNNQEMKMMNVSGHEYDASDDILALYFQNEPNTFIDKIVDSEPPYMEIQLLTATNIKSVRINKFSEHCEFLSLENVALVYWYDDKYYCFLLNHDSEPSLFSKTKYNWLMVKD